MKLKLRSDKNNKLGFVESHTHYFFSEKRVEVLCMADVGSFFSEPYVLRGDEFIPAAQIEKEMGVSKYIKAKKPFYSVIGTGNVIIKARIAMSMGANPEYLPEKSTYSIYGISKDSLRHVNGSHWEANMRRITTMSPALTEWFHTIGKQFVATGGDREQFLKSRFAKVPEGVL
jgi:hypothetical protein